MTPKTTISDGANVRKIEIECDHSPSAPKNRYGEAIARRITHYEDGTKKANEFTTMVHATLADLDGASNIATQVAAIGHMVDQLVLAHSILLQLHANLSRQAQAILLASGDDGEGAKQVQRMKGLCRAMLAVQFLRLAKNQLPADGESPARDFLALTGRGDSAGLAALVDEDQFLSSDAAKKARQMFADLTRKLKEETGEEETGEATTKKSKKIKRIVVNPDDPASLDSAIDLLRTEVRKLEKKRKKSNGQNDKSPNDKK